MVLLAGFSLYALTIAGCHLFSPHEGVCFDGRKFCDFTVEVNESNVPVHKHGTCHVIESFGLSDMEHAIQVPPLSSPVTYPSEYTKPTSTSCTANRNVLIGALFSNEVDTLEVALAEYKGVADVMLFEDSMIHNQKQHSSHRYLWPQLNKTARFEQFSPYWEKCQTVLDSPKDMWIAEKRSYACMNKRLLEVDGRYDIIIFANVDEVLSRDNIIRLKHCPLPPLPQSCAIGMPLGLVGRDFRSDWPGRGYPNSFAHPKIFASGSKQYGRSMVDGVPTLNTEPVVGGLHMTNYCYLPNIILKELTISDHEYKTFDVCGLGLKVLKQKCYDFMHQRVHPGTGSETVLPRALSKQRVPAWFGEIDPREQLMFDALCGDKN
eukprot:m.171990 g.171990  ORF g.171990 m.171990 type:complete len:377 (+) comp31666_c6_seq2:249-1379(+)